jgi:hypothetical protein
VAALVNHSVVSSKLALRSRKTNVRGRLDCDLTVERVRVSGSDWFWCDISVFVQLVSGGLRVAFLWSALAFSAGLHLPFSLVSLGHLPSISRGPRFISFLPKELDTSTLPVLLITTASD